MAWEWLGYLWDIFGISLEYELMDHDGSWQDYQSPCFNQHSFIPWITEQQPDANDSLNSFSTIFISIPSNNIKHKLVTPLKNMKVIWDDYSQYMEKKNVPNHQPVKFNFHHSPSNRMRQTWVFPSPPVQIWSAQEMPRWQRGNSALNIHFHSTLQLWHAHIYIYISE